MNNGRPGARAGYGIYVTRDDAEMYKLSQPIPSAEPQTNQYAELRALQHAILYAIESELPTLICTDSKYALQCLLEWGPKWKAAGWVKSDKRPIMHLHVIQSLFELMDVAAENRQSITFKHVAAHTRRTDVHSRGNAVADELATTAAAATATATAAATH